MQPLPPVHPGEILLEEFLISLGINVERLTQDIHLSTAHLQAIIQAQQPITADTALRLSRYFSLSERFWMNLQVQYDLAVQKDTLADRLIQDVKVLSR